MKTKLILAALIIAAMASCQNGSSPKNETALEVNLSNIPAECDIYIYRIEGEGGERCYSDSSRTTDRKFTIKCDSLSEATSFRIEIAKMGKERPIYLSYKEIYAMEGYTTKVSGSGIYAREWKVDSKNPKQAFTDKLDDACKEQYKQMCDISLTSDTISSNEGRMKYYKMEDELYHKIEENRLEAMKQLPIDEYWIDELKNFCGEINYEGKEYEFYSTVEELYNKIPEDIKNSKVGKSIYQALYGTAPQVGDKIIDYDLYDVNGNVHHLADYKGKWMLVDFSTYYCGACRMFTPAAKYFYQKGIDQKVEIITLSNDTQKLFKKMAEQEEYTNPLFNDRDKDNGIYSIYKVSLFPTFYFVNPEGVIDQIILGFDMYQILTCFSKAGVMPDTKIETTDNCTTIDYPTYNTGSGLWIEKVELYKDSTVLSVTSVNYSINEGTLLRYDNGKKSCKLISSSIGLNKFTSMNEGMKTARLTFEPLPKGTKEFDFIEGDCERCFRFEGIKTAQ